MALWEQRLGAAGDARQRHDADETLDDVRTKGVAPSLQRALVGDRRSAFLVLMGATALLLLIACANVTNLLLSHAASRRVEFALRGVLGASRGRLLRQVLAESIVLALAGAALGVMLAPAALGLLRTLTPSDLAGVSPVRLDLRVLTFAAALAIATGVAFGIWPAAGMARRDGAASLRSGGSRGATRAGASRARRLLVGTELALATMLLIGAGLLLRSFERVLHVDAGLAPDHVGTLALSFTRRSGVSGTLDRRRRIDAILGYLDRVPAISAAGVVNDLPLGVRGGIGLQLEVPGAPELNPGEVPYARYLMASGGYFGALGVPLLRGRTFTPADDSTAPPVAIVSAAMARRFWPGANPVGRVFRMGSSKDITVVGVVADVHEMGLEREPGLQVYFPIHQQTPANIAVVARSALSRAALLGVLRNAVRAADPGQAIYDVRMMDDVVGASVAPRRTNTVLISLFAALAVVLAALGVYAVVAYSVTQRTRELGIRAALGAVGSDLLSLLAREMLWVALGGILAGLSGAWALSRLLSTMVYGVDVHDAATFVAVPLVLVIPAMLATLIPARRALRVNPVDVMRAE